MLQLLTNLKYSDRMRVHVIANGRHVCAASNEYLALQAGRAFAVAAPMPPPDASAPNVLSLLTPIQPRFAVPQVPPRAAPFKSSSRNATITQNSSVAALQNAVENH